MKLRQLEAWVLSVVDRALAGHPNEDDRVELKAMWPADASRAARRIAAHANAARGDAVLWIIGVDEKRARVLGAAPEDFAGWMGRVREQFAGLAPDVQHLAVPTSHGTVVALLFGTDRPPYVVTNPVYGKPDGGPVTHEVPWREHTAVRTARREDLLRILVPLQRLPTLEPLSGAVRAKAERQWPIDDQLAQTHTWDIVFTVYVAPASGESVALPFHHTSLSFRFGAFAVPIVAPSLTLGPLVRVGYGSLSETVIGTGTEAIIRGPGTMVARAYFATRHLTINVGQPCVLQLITQPVGADAPIAVECTLAEEHTKPSDVDREWAWDDRRPKLLRGEGGTSIDYVDVRDSTPR